MAKNFPPLPFPLQKQLKKNLFADVFRMHIG